MFFLDLCYALYLKICQIYCVTVYSQKMLYGKQVSNKIK